MKYLALFTLLLSWPLWSGNKSEDLETMLRSTLQKRGEISVVDDLGFARRVSLDLTGQLPPEGQLAEFLASTEPEKRVAFIDLLLDSQAYRYRWKAFYRDLLSNRLILGRYTYRNAFDDYLNHAVSEDLGWDQMAQEILTAEGIPDADTSPTAYWTFRDFEQNYRLDILDDQIGQITESFLGVRTNCISCHDGAYHLETVNKELAKRKREEFWGMSAFLASTVSATVEAPFEWAHYQELLENLRIGDLDNPNFELGELVVMNPSAIMDGEYHAVSGGEGMRKPRRGGLVPPRYMFGGGEPLPGETRREALARLITDDRQFARNMVNRIWAQIFGEGLVDPVDDWDLGRIDAATAASNDSDPQPRNVALVELLADVFIENGYKVKGVLRILANSELYKWDYQHRPSVTTGTHDYWRSSARIRRLDAESIVDSIDQILGLDRLYFTYGRIGTYSTTWAMPDIKDPNPFALLHQAENTVEAMDLYHITDFNDYVHRIQAVTDALEKFGRGNLTEKLSRESYANVSASLIQLNSVDFNYYLKDLDAPVLVDLQAQIKSGEISLKEAALGMFRKILFRDPTEGEMNAITQSMSASQSMQSLSNVCWALFNHPEFLYK